MTTVSVGATTFPEGTNRGKIANFIPKKIEKSFGLSAEEEVANHLAQEDRQCPICPTPLPQIVRACSVQSYYS